MKVCTRCNIEKELAEFHRCKKSSMGCKNRCKKCRKYIAKIYNSKPENKIKNSLYQKERRSKEGYAEYRSNTYIKHRDKIRAQHKAYDSKIENKKVKLANGAKYRAAKLNATPKWLTKDQLEEIRKLYKEARKLELQDGVKRHVDHIVPLQGKEVKGLHVPWNLQILTEEENLRKSNKVIDG